MLIRWLTALPAVLLLGSCGGGPGNLSQALDNQIRSTGASQIRSNAARLLPGAAVNMDDVNCVQTAGTQQYSCIAHYDVTAASVGLDHQRYLVNISATCDSDSNCQWHTVGGGTPTGAG